MLDFTPLNWNEFFDRKELLSINEDKFNVYLKGSKGPLFCLLHGGGYTGLTWACFSVGFLKYFIFLTKLKGTNFFSN